VRVLAVSDGVVGVGLAGVAAVDVSVLFVGEE
jgi:hypothetical protein